MVPAEAGAAAARATAGAAQAKAAIFAV